MTSTVYLKKNKWIKKQLGIKDLQLAAVQLQLPVGNTQKTLKISLLQHMIKALMALEL